MSVSVKGDSLSKTPVSNTSLQHCYQDQAYVQKKHKKNTMALGKLSTSEKIEYDYLLIGQRR